jgi:uncharacterized membrane protein
MPTEKTRIAVGRHIYALGVMAIAVASLAFRNFDPGQPVPEHFPARIALAYAAGAFMLLAAAALEWRRTAPPAAAALTIYYTLFVVILMNGRLLLTDHAVYVTYENIAMQLAIAVGALISYATSAKLDTAPAERLTHLGRLAFGVCALIFGVAHFVYLNYTAPLVPRWLPPTQVFWACATGVAFLAAGVAFLTGVRARLAAILLTIMLATFGLLANGPMLLADHANHFNWTESAVNLAVVGAAWVLADSLAPPKR